MNKTNCIKLMSIILLSFLLCACNPKDTFNVIHYDFTPRTIEEYKELINSTDYKRVTCVLIIDDDNVGDDEILIDLYSFEDGGYAYIDTKDNFEANYPEHMVPEKDMIVCPSLNMKLDKDGTYHVEAKISSNKNVSYSLDLEYGNHYVISFEDEDKILKIYDK